jgi:hypothetical protein
MHINKMIEASVTILFVLLLALFSVSSFGQEGLSTLRGTATDASGAVVPGVSVTAREVLTNVVVRTVVTDAQGNYEMPALKSGSYQVTATLAGFKTFVVDDVRLQSNQVKRVDITLEVGEVATQVRSDLISRRRNSTPVCPSRAMPSPARTLFWPSCRMSRGNRVTGEAPHSPDRVDRRSTWVRTV